MRRALAHRPSPAMAVALLSLFISLGGGAWAALNLPKNSVGTRQLKNSSVTAAKLHKNAVTASKVKRHSLLATDFKAGQLPSGPPGPPGQPGQQGPQGPGNSTWQIIVNGDGSTQYVHPGMSVTRNSVGDYTVSWTGFPGHGSAYCMGFARNGTLLGEHTNADGTGGLTIDFGGTDTTFHCVVIGETG